MAVLNPLSVSELFIRSWMTGTLFLSTMIYFKISAVRQMFNFFWLRLWTLTKLTSYLRFNEEAASEILVVLTLASFMSNLSWSRLLNDVLNWEMWPLMLECKCASITRWSFRTWRVCYDKMGLLVVTYCLIVNFYEYFSIISSDTARSLGLPCE